MKQVVAAVQRDDFAVVCGSWDELKSCLDALEKLGKSGKIDQQGSGEPSHSYWTTSVNNFFETLTSCSKGCTWRGWTEPDSPFPGSVWEVHLKRDAGTLKIVDACVKAQEKTDHLSRACTQM